MRAQSINLSQSQFCEHASIKTPNQDVRITHNLMKMSAAGTHTERVSQHYEGANHFSQLIRAQRRTFTLKEKATRVILQEQHVSPRITACTASVVSQDVSSGHAQAVFGQMQFQIFH